jgi:kynurenine/2-aminoadipate aminotransferase
MDYTRFLTRTALARKPSPIRALLPLASRPGMISLGGGMPNPALFPFASLTLGLAGGETLAATPADVREALQYSGTAGLPELLARLRAVQLAEHAPPGPPVACAVVPGSQDGLAKLFDALLEDGDSVIVEAPTYSGSLAYLEAKRCRFVSVPTDGDGLDVAALARALDGWDAPRDGRKPRVLYCIPTGGNPTGASLSARRRHELYALLQRHDLLCIEDDPYYYLGHGGGGGARRGRSLLSLDVDGRVVRTDSLSKVLSAGLRLGLVTGPEPLLERLLLHNQASLLHPSGLSQMAALLLFRHWRVGEAAAAAGGGDGSGAGGGGGGGGGGGLGAAFEAHLAAVGAFYAAQCGSLEAAARAHLVGAAGEPLARWARPSAGMFLWLDLAPAGVGDTMALMAQAVQRNVLLVPGAAFFPGAPRTPYVRAAFSTATPGEMDAAMARLGALLRERPAAGGGGGGGGGGDGDGGGAAGGLR